MGQTKQIKEPDTFPDILAAWILLDHSDARLVIKNANIIAYCNFGFVLPITVATLGYVCWHSKKQKKFYLYFPFICILLLSICNCVVTLWLSISIKSLNNKEETQEYILNALRIQSDLVFVQATFVPLQIWIFTNNYFDVAHQVCYPKQKILRMVRKIFFVIGCLLIIHLPIANLIVADKLGPEDEIYAWMKNNKDSVKEHFDGQDFELPDSDERTVQLLKLYRYIHSCFVTAGAVIIWLSSFLMIATIFMVQRLINQINLQQNVLCKTSGRYTKSQTRKVERSEIVVYVHILTVLAVGFMYGCTYSSFMVPLRRIRFADATTVISGTIDVVTCIIILLICRSTKNEGNRITIQNNQCVYICETEDNESIRESEDSSVYKSRKTLQISYLNHYGSLNRFVDEGKDVQIDYDLSVQDHLLLLSQFMRSARSNTTDSKKSKDSKTVVSLIESDCSEDWF